MTGFGRAEAEIDDKKITVEVKTVNHRFLDINIRSPRTLGFAEELVRKSIKKKLSRGRVDVFVNYVSLGGGEKTAVADMGLIRSFVSAARQAAEECELEDDLMISHIVRIPDAIVVQEEKEDEQALGRLVTEALENALDMLCEMRAREGEHLEKNISGYVEELKEAVTEIEERKGYVTGEYKDKLKQRIAELLEGADIDEARFNTEIAYIADKADITEEIVRMNTHIKEFGRICGHREAVGRKLDFIVQEMNREMNTIGSKSSDTKITNAVIDGKSLVEKIREQVQNIE